MRRGRLAKFPPQSDSSDADTAATTTTVDPRRFAVRVDTGNEFIVDLTDLTPSSFVVEIAPLLRERIRQMGPTPIWRSVRNSVKMLRRFWSFLDAQRHTIRALGDVTVELIDGYEDWLEQNAGNRSSQRQLLATLISVLRIAVNDRPGVLTPDVVSRLRYLGRGHGSGGRPRDAYSSGIAEALRTAARTQVANARERIVLGDDLPAPPLGLSAGTRLRVLYDAVLVEIARSSWIEAEHPAFKRFANLARYHKIDCKIELPHRGFHLTVSDFAAFLVLLSLETGMEMECLNRLKADCLRNPTRGYVEIEYYKPRARGSEWKHVRVRDGSIATPGGLMRLAISLTERARRHTGSDRLWVLWTVNGLRSLSDDGTQGVDAFVERYKLTDDEGRPLRLQLSRLRKTFKAEWYRRTNGQLEQFAVGHSIPVAARHYADIPALRHVHEQTLADAFHDALDAALRPRLVTSEQENPAVEPQDQAPAKDDQDVWMARCGNFYDSPFAKAGDPCPTPFWGCLECENAVISERKLPALLAFQSFMADQRAALNAEEWSVKFARAWHRITHQIIPAFAPQVLEAARRTTDARDPMLLYLPVEAIAR
ncbi:phage integrase SAM-like domain-containing protein [Ensifer sp. YR511]|uniref:phage integrase SAM-like domain-containing protein n=1 Tax=Ensifer sp. YR511 TaxID=1855294 RepID=UPI00088A21A3|nr:phage integrase SAM-like domain-containing protein [Ensifer sp. YR511]SDN38013.1 hypothetical protein SAMN05216328_1252 [Ensifer sp. YR511]SDN48228.1 hypothetical protein SAMN05216328_12790 [Ensifer sp. YR511]SDN66426.1 hypothetical protein SAMN05216328_13259 [Ensifer sp. YR511]SDN95054.1 hypothetical protein SAMN05216328_1444 [Ensifer sp. YR511]